MNIAAWVTLSRLFLLPPAILPLAAGWHNGWLVIATVVALAGLTDWLDGYLARRSGNITATGISLDLMVDKIFIDTMFCLAAWSHLIPLWVPLVIILRDIIISWVRFSRFRSCPTGPDAMGKTKTAVSFTALIMIFLEQNLAASGGVQNLQPLFLSVTTWFLLASVILTLCSGMNYLRKYFRLSW